MGQEQSEGPVFSFSDIYHELFTTKDTDSEVSLCLRSGKAPLDVRVVLECLHTLVRENRETIFKVDRQNTNTPRGEASSSAGVPAFKQHMVL
jgi:hypothetical protein